MTTISQSGMASSIHEETKSKQRISSVIEKRLKPILMKYAGRQWNQAFARAIQKTIFEETGKYVGFRSVNVMALHHAVADLDPKNDRLSFSFNIVPTQTLVDEYNLSTPARRERFRVLFNPHPLLQDEVMLRNRFQIQIPKIRSVKQYDVQVIIDSRGNAWPVAVIGYYGSNMNGWAKRVALKQTQKAHSHPSTHYMSVSKGKEYVFIFEEIASKFL